MLSLYVFWFVVIFCPSDIADCLGFLSTYKCRLDTSAACNQCQFMIKARVYLVLERHGWAMMSTGFMAEFGHSNSGPSL
jgi:hypothetical protein